MEFASQATEELYNQINFNNGRLPTPLRNQCNK